MSLRLLCNFLLLILLGACATPPQSAALSQQAVPGLPQLQETGQSDTAARGFATALQRWPMDAMLLVGAGNLHHAQGDPAAALVHFRRALGGEFSAVFAGTLERILAASE